MKRREFLKMVGMGGAGLVLSGCQAVIEKHPVATATKELVVIATKIPPSPTEIKPTSTTEPTKTATETQAAGESVSTMEELISRFPENGRLISENIELFMDQGFLDKLGIKGAEIPEDVLQEIYKCIVVRWARAMARNGGGEEFAPFKDLENGDLEGVIRTFDEAGGSELVFDFGDGMTGSVKNIKIFTATDLESMAATDQYILNNDIETIRYLIVDDVNYRMGFDKDGTLLVFHKGMPEKYLNNGVRVAILYNYSIVQAIGEGYLSHLHGGKGLIGPALDISNAIGCNNYCIETAGSGTVDPGVIEIIE